MIVIEEKPAEGDKIGINGNEPLMKEIVACRSGGYQEEHYGEKTVRSAATRVEYFQEIEMYIAVETENGTIKQLRLARSLEDLDCYIDDLDPDCKVPLFLDLHRYFGGEDVDFSKYRIDLSKYTPFAREVLETVSKIPSGKTLSYSDVAETIGKAKAYRAVGRAVGSNRTLFLIPCHRVVGKHGLGGFGDLGPEFKSRLLEMEKGNR